MTANKCKRLVQRDRRDGLLIDSWPVDGPAYIEVTVELCPHYTTETGFQAIADFRAYLEAGHELRTAGFVYRIEG